MAIAERARSLDGRIVIDAVHVPLPVEAVQNGPRQDDAHPRRVVSEPPPGEKSPYALVDNGPMKPASRDLFLQRFVDVETDGRSGTLSDPNASAVSSAV